MKIIAISDLHGLLPNIEEDFDLMLICGDICPTYCHDWMFQDSWIKYDFINWINNLNFKNKDSKVVFIGGNHDNSLEKNENIGSYISKHTNDRAVYLLNQSYLFHYKEHDNIKTYKIFGTPYCKIFNNWAFMLDKDGLKEKYSEMPNDIDILISHDSPMIGEIGIVHSGKKTGNEYGSEYLAEAIYKHKPKYVFSGHIHSGDHNLTEIDGVKLYNVSLLDEDYKPSYKPLILNI